MSYFLRNSIAYDTLMQMGRWFGYRPGYEDLCRIYMTDESRGYYAHITLATEELRKEFKKMISMGMTPRDFGLKVRNHPESLIVTARNKMRSAKTHFRELDLAGQEIQTNRLFRSQKLVNDNFKVALRLYNNLKKESSAERPQNKKDKLWRSIGFDYVINFLENFVNHPESMQTETDAILKYVNEIAEKASINKWNIAFISPRGDSNIRLPDGFDDISPSLRKNVSKQPKNGILFNHRSLTSAGTRKLDLVNDETRKVPLLAVYIVDCRLKDKPDEPLFKNGIVGYGIYFPGVKVIGRQKILATYQVNTTWMKNQYSFQFEDEDDMGGDIQ